ncbi:MAG: choice-of-anchor J domain-containing protein [Bacteroidales bacterium]|nr:choice-of-anchor J domain-containing protein [Bacteroidales bacterium]
MKRYYCFLALFALLGLGTAQAQITTFPYTQGFESGLGGWTTVDGDNDGENWFSSTGSDEDIDAHGGNSYASSWSYDNVYGDSWNPNNYLISPAITVTSGLNLSYYVIRGCGSSYPDQYSLYVSTSATPSDINALTPLITESPSETGWTKKTFSLEDYAGQTVYIVFRHHNSYDMCSIGIDDVTIAEAGIPEVMLPGPQTASIGSPLNIGASVVGAQPLTLTWSSVMASNGDATMYDNGDTLTITYSASGLDTVMLIASNSFGADTATTVVNAYCVAPTSITTTSSSIDSALFSWTGEATDYEYALMVGSAEPGENDIFTTTDNSVLYDTLQGGVTYTFYVRALCGTSHSSWITRQHTPGTYILAANSSDTLRTCGSVIYDDGGPEGNYASNQNSTLYILPTDDTKWVVISGSSYTEGTWDYIRLYDGMGTSGEQLFNDYGISANTSFGPFMCPAGATLTFHSDGSVNYSGFQINVTCIDAPTCLAPTNLTLVRAAEDTLVVSWNAPEGGASDYLVQYRSGSDEWSSLTVTDTVAAIDGLSANTVYEVVVRTLCGNDSSFSISGAYRTACGAISTLPWSESFETFDSGTRDTLVNCWNFIWPTGGSSNGYCQVVGSNAVTGNNSLRFSGYASTPMTAILPPFTDDISGMEMSFYLRAENSNAYSGTTNSPGAIRVGYITSIGDSTTFVQTARFECTSGNYGSMALEEVTFAGAPSGARIAIQQVNNGTNYWWWIDDIDVHVAPSCTRPTVAVSDVATDGATLTLNDASEVGNYRLVVVSGSNSDTIDNVTSPYVLTGLASGSAYTVYAYTVCDDGTLTSAATASFRTACDVVSTFPWSENFDARATGTFNDPCWENVHISGSGSSLFSVSSSTQGGNSTNKLQLPDMSSGTMTKLSLPPMQFETGTAYLFSIDVYRNTSSYPNEGVRVFVNDTNDFAGAVELGFLHRNYQQTDGRVVTAESASGWYTYEFLIPDTIENPVYIILRGESSYGSSTYMDSLSVAVAPSCMRPASIDVTSVDSTSVTLAINDANNTGSYHIVILSGNDTVVNETIASNTYTTDTLQPATLYTVLVSTLCDDGTETTTTTTTFNTSCVAVTAPWLEDFNSEASWLCWNTLSFDNEPNSDWTLSSGVATSSYNEVAAANDWLITPAIEVPSDADGLALTWKATGASYDGYNTHLTVRLSTTSTDTASFSTVLFNNDLPDAWNSYSASLDSYAGETIYVAFIHDSYNDDGPSIDSVQVRSTLVPVVSIVADATTADAGTNLGFRAVLSEGSTTGINYTWTNTLAASTISGSGDSINIAYTVAGEDTVTVIVTNSYGADTASVFVRVRDCQVVSVFPWTVDFENSGDIECWSQEGSSQWRIGTGDNDSSTGAHGGTGNVLITHSSIGNVTKLITPVLNLGGASSATLTFWHIQRVWAGDQDELNVYYRTSQSDPWTLITSYTSNIATWTADTLTLPNTTATYQVAFEMVDDWGYGVAIDDITISGANGPQTSFVVSATSANATMGTATVSPNGTVAAGTSVTATATANEGYQFVNWTVSGNVVSNANPYTFTVTANTALVANFEALPEPDCETPTNVTVSDVTLTSATIAWTAGEGQNSWDVHVTGIGYDQTFTTSTNPYTVTGLNADVVYTVTVRANCSATAFSEWSAPATFTTSSCQSVSGVTASNVTTNSAQVSWTAVQGVNGYEVEYGASGFNQGAGTTVQASTNNATLTGLTANMAYDVYVRSVCGEGVYSAWSNVTSFTTDEGEGIDDVNSAAIALYPNPATTTVTISGIEGQAMVTIVDMNGRVSGEWKVENDEITLDLTGYAQGAYFVRIMGEQQNAIRKLIVK